MKRPTKGEKHGFTNLATRHGFAASGATNRHLAARRAGVA